MLRLRNACLVTLEGSKPCFWSFRVIWAKVVISKSWALRDPRVTARLLYASSTYSPISDCATETRSQPLEGVKPHSNSKVNSVP